MLTLHSMFYLLQFSIFLQICYCGAPARVVRDFFNIKSIEIIQVHTCNTKEAVKLIRGLTNYGLQVFIGKESAHCYEHNQRNYYGDKTQRYGIYIDTSCNSGLDIIQSASSRDAFNASQCWLLWHTDSDLLFHIVKEIQFGMTSDVSLAAPYPAGCDIEGCDNKNLNGIISDNNKGIFNDTYYKEYDAEGSILLYDVYKTLPWKPLIKQLVGGWTVEGGLIIYRKPKRVYSMGGVQYNCGIFLTEKVYHVENLSKELQDGKYMAGHDIANRLYYSTNLHMADLYNFSLNLIVADGWGSKQKSGTWDGLLGMIFSGVINMTNSPMQLLPIRLEVANFLMPAHLFRFPFIFKQPRSLGTYRTLSLQLQTPAWISVGGMLVICLLVHWAVQRIYWKSETPDGEANLSAAAVQIVGIVAQQGLSQDTKRVSARIVCIFMLMLALMVCVYYNAATMNALLSPAPVSIRNLRDLLSSNIPLYVMDVPYFTIKATRERLLSKAVIDKLTSRENFSAPLEGGLDIILNGGAFCGEDFTLYTAIRNRFKDSNKCDLSIILAFPPKPAGNYMSKFTHYRELFSRGVMRMREYGLINRQIHRWYPKKPSCLAKTEFILVDLRAVTIAMSIMMSGIVISFVVFLLELVKFRITNSYMQRNKVIH